MPLKEGALFSDQRSMKKLGDYTPIRQRQILPGMSIRRSYPLK